MSFRWIELGQLEVTMNKVKSIHVRVRSTFPELDLNKRLTLKFDLDLYKIHIRCSSSLEKKFEIELELE